MPKKFTTESFIAKSRLKFGDKFDYSLVVYIDMNTEVCLICPIHGPIWIKPSNHLNCKTGCTKCGGKYVTDLDSFKERASIIHKGKYDYSKAIYKGNGVKLCIICPIHGEFWQTPNEHLLGYGCSKCVDNEVLTTEEFIRRAREVHGEKYDYSKVIYVNNKTKVCIICPEHGEFWQTPHSHLNGNGCRQCHDSKLEREIRLLLRSNGFKFEEQKTFDWLKYKSNLFLDFYIPEYNLAIECQGDQHFRPIEKFGGVENFEKTVARDDAKNKLCTENKITILYFTKTKTDYRYKLLRKHEEVIEKIYEKEFLYRKHCA